MSILAQGISYIYAPGTPFEVRAIDNLSFSIEDGEFVGVIGHTGSGKSTLMQCLNGLIRPSAGTLTVQGVRIEPKVGLRQLRQKVGLVFQYPEYQLFEETVLKDVAFGPRNLGLSEAEVQQRVEGTLRLVGIDPLVLGPRSPFELSGGQRRRVALAGVLAMNPEVLILDEPSAGLDPRGRTEILELVSNIHRERGCTILMVSHSMDEVAKVAQRVMVLNHGELMMDGPTREIYARGQELEAMGLGVPATVRLLAALREKGIEAPRDLLTPAELADWILAEVGHE